MCTQYRGRGLEPGFSESTLLTSSIISLSLSGTRYKVEEVIETDEQNRLFFDPSLSTNSIIKNITFPGPNLLTCDNVTAYVKVKFDNKKY